MLYSQWDKGESSLLGPYKIINAKDDKGDRGKEQYLLYERILDLQGKKVTQEKIFCNIVDPDDEIILGVLKGNVPEIEADEDQNGNDKGI